METTVEERSSTVAIVRFKGRLDFLSSATAREQFQTLIATGRNRLVIDLGGLSFIDSSGLGALIGGLKGARQASGDLRLAEPTPQATSVLKLTSLDRVFRTYGTVEEAIADY